MKVFECWILVNCIPKICQNISQQNWKCSPCNAIGERAIKSQNKNFKPKSSDQNAQQWGRTFIFLDFILPVPLIAKFIFCYCMWRNQEEMSTPFKPITQCFGPIIIEWFDCIVRMQIIVVTSFKNWNWPSEQQRRNPTGRFAWILRQMSVSRFHFFSSIPS